MKRIRADGHKPRYLSKLQRSLSRSNKLYCSGGLVKRILRYWISRRRHLDCANAGRWSVKGMGSGGLKVIYSILETLPN